MICKRVLYRNFRNIEQAELCPSPQVTVLHGDNGQGKTNALEGIYLFAQGRSFRTAKESELIRFGEQDASVTLFFADRNREMQMSIRWSAERKRRFCRVNGYPVTKMSELIGSFRAVLFAPQHLSLVRDGPNVRRTFLDVAISQLEPHYIVLLQRFNRILEQRNACIRKIRETGSQKPFLETVEVLSEQLAEVSALICERRCRYVAQLEEQVRLFFGEMTGQREKPSLRSVQNRSEEEFLSQLTSHLDREVRYGATLFGAHKDDVSILLNDKEARAFASQGQQRSLALAMKLAEGEISKDASGEYPVFLFDDVLSELDEKRRSFLLSGMKDRQVIVTSCESFPFPCSLCHVENGMLQGGC